MIKHILKTGPRKCLIQNTYQMYQIKVTKYQNLEILDKGLPTHDKIWATSGSSGPVKNNFVPFFKFITIALKYIQNFLRKNIDLFS